MKAQCRRRWWVAAAISERLADKYPLVLCVMTGGVVFAASC
jgi:hypoxanthine-guanine phosphoribosyltransferase